MTLTFLSYGVYVIMPHEPSVQDLKPLSEVVKEVTSTSSHLLASCPACSLYFQSGPPPLLTPSLPNCCGHTTTLWAPWLGD